MDFFAVNFVVDRARCSNASLLFSNLTGANCFTKLQLIAGRSLKSFVDRKEEIVIMIFVINKYSRCLFGYEDSTSSICAPIYVLPH